VGSAVLKAALGAAWPFISAILLVITGSWIKYRFDKAKTNATPSDDALVVAPSEDRRSWMRRKRDERQH